MFWNLIRKDFQRRRRSPASTLVMLLFPLLMAGLIGAINSDDGKSATRLRLFLLDREDGFLGRFLQGAGQQAGADRELAIERVGEEGFARMEKGEASALLVIPERFTDRLLDGEEVALQLVLNPAESIKPEIIAQGAGVVATYLDVAVKNLGDRLAHLRDLMNAETMPPVVMITSITGEIYREMVRAEPLLLPPVVRITSEKQSADQPRWSIFGYVLVMVSVMSVLFVAMRAAADLYEDQRTGMLRRQLASPLSIGRLLAVKAAFALIFGVAVMVILLAIGAICGWLPGPQPVFWVLLHTVCFAGAAAGLMMVMMALVTTEKQAGILSWIVVMVMSVLGGSMFPVESLPDAIRQFSHFTLNYWAVEGFLDLMVRHNSPAAALPRTLVLAGVGAVLLLSGQALMERRLRKALR